MVKKAKETKQTASQEKASEKSAAVKASDDDVRPFDEEETQSELERLLDLVETVIARIVVALNQFISEMPDTVITDSDRRRLQGSGIRRYGFIDKVSDLALAWASLTPPYMDEEKLKQLLRLIEALRNLSNTLTSLNRSTNDQLLVFSDEAYKESLKFYGSVRDAARRQVPNAETVYQALLPFFKRPSRQGEEPTEPEVERDLRSLLHGKKDGKIVIENVRPHMVGGKHVVVDEMHKDKGAWKATEEGKL
jgi:hypothetical protein